jgi:general bacterial porin, GBP family
MFKKLLPVVGLLAFAGAAQAQETVTLYGIADANVRIDHTAIGTLKSLGSGGESASRWGLRGTEDLGGGLKAIFNFEQDFDLGDNSVPQGVVTPTTPNSPVSTTSARLFGRRSIVGLNSTSWGEIRAGRDYTPFYTTWLAADPFGNGTVARGNNISVGSITRNDNTITYETISYSGLKFTAQFKPGESDTNSVASGSTKSGGNANSFSLTYSQGPLYLGGAYIATKSAIDNNTVRSETAAAMYDFGFLKLHGLYFHTKNQTTTKAQSYGLGFTVPIGTWKILGLAGRIDNKFIAAGNNSPQFNDANFFGAGVTYALSKRTDLYVAGSKFKNMGQAAFIISDSSNNGLYTATNVPAGFDPWSAQIGMRFLF